MKLVTAPDEYPVTLVEAKAHLGVTFSNDDTIIEIYLNAAISHIEQVLQRKLITQTWKMYLDYFPPVVHVGFGDLQSVTHIKYTDVDDIQETFSSDSYYVDTISVPGRILLKDGETWPTVTLNTNNPIEIQFVTGYGAESENIPNDLRSAILLTTAHLYENRENTIVSNVQSMTIEKIPWTAETLIQPHRVWGWII